MLPTVDGAGSGLTVQKHGDVPEIRVNDAGDSPVFGTLLLLGLGTALTSAPGLDVAR